MIRDLTVINSESVHIEWNIPAETNGALTIYTVLYTVENGPKRSLIVDFNGQNVSHYNVCISNDRVGGNALQL